jgi:hypothetical protein
MRDFLAGLSFFFPTLRQSFAKLLIASTDLEVVSINTHDQNGCCVGVSDAISCHFFRIPFAHPLLPRASARR